MEGGRRRKAGATVKTLKRVLKKAGLKVSGKKAALTRRAKKAHLKLKGGADEMAASAAAAAAKKAEEDAKKAEEDAKKAEAAANGSVGGRKRRSSSRRGPAGFPRLY
jgi:hypothetical protein